MKTIITFYLIILFFSAYTQRNTYRHIDSLIINNPSLIQIIDSLMINEKECDYYNQDLTFHLDIQKYNMDTFILSIDISKNFLSIDIDSAFGYFIYLDHQFLVTTEDSIAPLNLFHKTSFMKQVRNQDIDILKNSRERITIFFDDLYANYLFFLIREKLIYHSGYPPCPR